MADLSNYLEVKLLDHSLGTTAFTAPTDVYLALYTSDPGDDASGTEVTGGGYTREVVTFTAASTDVSDVSSCTNAADVEFGPATDGTWGTVTHVAVYDALTTGNMLWHGAAPASKTIADADSAIIRAGDLTVELA